KILGGEFDALEPVRLHVVRKHASRSIDREKQVESFAFHILVYITDLRPRQTHDRERKSKHQKSESQNTPRTVHSCRKLRQQFRRNEFAQSRDRALFRSCEQNREHRNRKQGPKPFWRSEGHGSFFQIVCERRSCATSKPAPLMMQSGNKSRYC